MLLIAQAIFLLTVSVIKFKCLRVTSDNLFEIYSFLCTVHRVHCAL